ncbi:MAG: DUF4494 domain-containing protein [Alloprevotella sp.]|nr:DUF4494 domain-containing protein [Alloprevotella sp.]
MSEWYQCTVKYEKTMEDGALKKVSEPYLIDALSFTEAEKRTIEELSHYISGIFEVSDIKKARYVELFESTDDAADRYFKAKISIITLDENSGTEKRVSQNLLVQAADLRDALKRLDEGLKGTMADYLITSLAETPIMDVFHHPLGATSGSGKKDETAEE